MVPLDLPLPPSTYPLPRSPLPPAPLTILTLLELHGHVCSGWDTRPSRVYILDAPFDVCFHCLVSSRLWPSLSPCPLLSHSSLFHLFGTWIKFVEGSYIKMEAHCDTGFHPRFLVYEVFLESFRPSLPPFPPSPSLTLFSPTILQLHEHARSGGHIQQHGGSSLQSTECFLKNSVPPFPHSLPTLAPSFPPVLQLHGHARSGGHVQQDGGSSRHRHPPC